MRTKQLSKQQGKKDIQLDDEFNGANDMRRLAIQDLQHLLQRFTAGSQWQWNAGPNQRLCYMATLC